MPSYTLHHLIKERYPRFVDALSDMDDALTLTYLFAALPGDGEIKPVVTSKAKKLAAAWGAYCATTSSITKSFISVKGVYLEASVHGVPIRWIVPHSFTQHLPEDVDYRVLLTYFELYETLLGFILFKLYSDIGVRYPFPLKDLGAEMIGNTSSILGANLRALQNALSPSQNAITSVVSATASGISNGTETKIPGANETSKPKKKSKDLIKSVGVALNKLAREESDNDDEDIEEDGVDVSGPLHAALENAVEDDEKLVPGFDPEVGIDDAHLKRKRLFEGLTFFLSREVPRGYLELICLSYGGKVGWEGSDSPISFKDPSITHHIVDRPKLPASYDSINTSREFLQPQWILDSANFMFLLPISRYALGRTLPPHLSPWVDDEEEGYKPAYAEEIERLKNGDHVDLDTDLSRAKSEPDVSMREKVDEADGEDEDLDEDDVDDKKTKLTRERKRRKEEDEAHKLAKTVMSRKAAHLYDRMQFGIARKKAKVETLNQRRREIESSKEKDSSGKSILKQKVERLKNERKRVEETYSNTGGSMKKRKAGRSK